MPDKKRLGGECKLYRNTGTYGTPTWNEVTEVEDLSLGLSKGAGEFRTRASKWVKKKGGKIEASLEWKHIYDPGDDDFVVIRDAFLNSTSLDISVFDGAIATAGNQGLRANMEILEFPVDEPLEDGVSIAVSAAPTIADNEPVWNTTP